MEVLGSGMCAVQLDFEGGYAWRRCEFGDIASGVNAVRVVLDDGTTVFADIHPMADGTQDLFVVFQPPKSSGAAAQALDAEGRVLAEPTHDASALERRREARKAVEPDRWAT